MVPGSINHSDDELAFLLYYPLLRYEKIALLEVYKQSLERSWQIDGRNAIPLWNFIYAAGTGAEESIGPSRCARCGRFRWIKSSGRSGTHTAWMCPSTPERSIQTSSGPIVLPYDELPMSKWTGTGNLDGGNDGRSEDDGAYFLLPYWMGRYHQLIVE